MWILATGDPIEHVLPHDLFKIGSLWITNQMLMALVAAVLMLLTFPVLFIRPHPSAPGGARNFFESILEYLRVEVIRPALKEHTDRFLPFLWTLFFFILFCNLLGSIPFAEIIGLATHGRVLDVGGTATGTVMTTGALAICALIVIHLSGIVQIARSLIDGTYGHHPHHEEHSSDGGASHETAHDLEHLRGEALPVDAPGNVDALVRPTDHYRDDEHTAILGADPVDHSKSHSKGMNPGLAILAAVPLYLWNFAPHPMRPGPNDSKGMWVADVFLWGMLLILEMVGALIKPFALTIRLFANMIAGHLVLAVLVGFIALASGIFGQIMLGVPVTVLSLLIRLLELFVAFLQAYIFTFLTTLFIASAVAPEH